MRVGTLMAGEDLIRHVIGGTGEVDEFLDWPNPRLDVEPPWALATGLFWRVEVEDIGCSGCHELSAPQAGLRRLSGKNDTLRIVVDQPGAQTGPVLIFWPALGPGRLGCTFALARALSGASQGKVAQGFL